MHDHHLCLSYNANKFGSQKGSYHYNSSVDTWSVGTVLFHLLSGHPPWPGSSQDTSDMMLQKIVFTHAQWENLNAAGVSDMGVHCLSAMLKVDPIKRATDAEILDHPWVQQIRANNPVGDVQSLDETGLSSQNDFAINADQVDLGTPDPSQLQINDISGSLEYDGNQIIDNANDLSSHDVGDFNETARSPATASSQVLSHSQPLGYGTAHQELRHGQNQNNVQMAHAGRLFGEIPPLALQDAGLLNRNAHEALDLQENRGIDQVTDGLDDDFMHNDDDDEDGQEGKGYNVSCKTELT